MRLLSLVIRWTTLLWCNALDCLASYDKAQLLDFSNLKGRVLRCRFVFSIREFQPLIHRVAAPVYTHSLIILFCRPILSIQMSKQANERSRKKIEKSWAKKAGQVSWLYSQIAANRFFCSTFFSLFVFRLLSILETLFKWCFEIRFKSNNSLMHTEYLYTL